MSVDFECEKCVCQMRAPPSRSACSHSPIPHASTPSQPPWTRLRFWPPLPPSSPSSSSYPLPCTLPRLCGLNLVSSGQPSEPCKVVNNMRSSALRSWKTLEISLDYVVLNWTVKVCTGPFYPCPLYPPFPPCLLPSTFPLAPLQLQTVNERSIEYDHINENSVFHALDKLKNTAATEISETAGSFLGECINPV